MSYEKIMNDNRQWVDSVWEKLEQKVSRTAVENRYKIPYTTKDGIYDDYSEGQKITWWTNGFWGGLMWLMYSETQKECYKTTAEISEEKLDRAFRYMDDLHHDVGFMWHILSGASYRLTGNRESRNRNLLAAQILMARYNIDGEFIVAWNGKECTGWSIIDTMMNLPLLYWAAKETGDSRYIKVAKKHADMAMRDHVRPDGSAAHIVSHNVDKPEVLEFIGGQGYDANSCWSRGASWAIYGFTLSYMHTWEIKYLETAKKVAHYFVANAAASNWLPEVDFRAPEKDCYFDSTAGAVAACGLIEIANHVPENEKDFYLDSAIRLLKAMEKEWCDWSEENASILQNGTERYGGSPMHIIYGDYFFAEAILKLRGNDFLPW